MEKSIQEKITKIIEHKKQTRADRESSTRIAQNIQSLNPPELQEKNYNNILEILDDLDIVVDEKMSIIIQTMDEKYVETYARNRLTYYQMLNDLKNEIQLRLENL